ncbi:MAG: PD40 domain-containing protein [Candidatus Schekmanbacteria bacterium]|nr:PD40 domain-containing protein [Candidatus Schekmanbacteria bacterium]
MRLPGGDDGARLLGPAGFAALAVATLLATAPRFPSGVEAGTDSFEGRIVWASNRGGNHDIYLLTLGAGTAPPQPEKLTSSPLVDTFPRFSPDGRRILFGRSREPGVSFREQAPWDVWVMNADGSEQRRVAAYGFHAGFGGGSDSIVFSRGSRIVRLDLVTGQEEELADLGALLGGQGAEPELRDGKLAVTVRGGQRAFGLVELSTMGFRAFPGPGCQLGWVPGEARVVWIEGRGSGGTRVMIGSPDAGSREVLIDLPGERSHEYFPRLSRDGRWLAWAAAAHGHEHDTADYDIFLWRRGTPWESAQRLAPDAGNDQWPDLLAAAPESPAR